MYKARLWESSGWKKAVMARVRTFYVGDTSEIYLKEWMELGQAEM